ncbi:MAG: hypothetical protein SOI44_05055 [Lactimicrobium sp.]|jgi:hypothetical protein|uniref:hypothetical protein n=1 Tax=Lactimicrobium sp. TaxID=2563780 RepID=UPI002F35FA74
MKKWNIDRRDIMYPLLAFCLYGLQAAALYGVASLLSSLFATSGTFYMMVFALMIVSGTAVICRLGFGWLQENSNDEALRYCQMAACFVFLIVLQWQTGLLWAAACGVSFLCEKKQNRWLSVIGKMFVYGMYAWMLVFVWHRFLLDGISAYAMLSVLFVGWYSHLCFKQNAVEEAGLVLLFLPFMNLYLVKLGLTGSLNVRVFALLGAIIVLAGALLSGRLDTVRDYLFIAYGIVLDIILFMANPVLGLLGLLDGIILICVVPWLSHVFAHRFSGIFQGMRILCLLVFAASLCGLYMRGVMMYKAGMMSVLVWLLLCFSSSVESLSKAIHHLLQSREELENQDHISA